MNARAVVFDRVGGPEVLRIEEIPMPVPGPGEVLVEMRAIGINRADSAFRTGKYLVQPSGASRLGLEGAGVVLDPGAGADRFAPGERVCVLPAFIQGGRYATYATHAIFPEAALIAAPDQLTDVESAALWVSFLTSWGAMVELGRLSRGQFVLISAAASAVGLAALQVANRVGAVPIATTRTRAKRILLENGGAAHVILSEESDVGAEIRRITEGSGLSVALDAIAGPFTEALVPCMAPEGVIFVYGGLSDQPIMFDRRPIIAKGISMAGFTVAQILRHMDRLDRGVSFILEGLADGSLSPSVSRTFAFEDVAEAHRIMDANTNSGKLVLAL